MSKKVVTNTWNDGLNKDLNPNVTPNTVLTDNLNGTFITYNGNELSLQNDMGNKFVTSVTEGFFPIGITEYEGIAYIVSIKPENNKVNLKLKHSETESLNSVIDRLRKSLTEDFSNNTLETLFKTGKIVSYSDFVTLVTGVKKCGLSYEVLDSEEDSNYTFEIGSFPSLNPDGIDFKFEDQQDSKELEFDPIYRPLHNLISNDSNGTVKAFSTTSLVGYDLEHPVHIEVQPSYDGSVNLILTDGKNPIRMINTGFAAIGNNRGKFTKRNQGIKTNYYADGEGLDQLTKLIKTTESFTEIDLNSVQAGGKLKGGNYTFYVRLGDEDGNKTDIVAESGIVSIFHGTIGVPNTISGAFADEITDKLAILEISRIDQAYSNIYISYIRETCDFNGVRVTKACEILDPYTVTGESTKISITGSEKTVDISIEDLNVVYHVINSAKTAIQQQGMLFLGNVDLNSSENYNLQELSYLINACVKQGTNSDTDTLFGNIDPEYTAIGGAMYYDPKNIYYNVGYWPNEYYRFGVVYIKSGGVLTQVYNLHGCLFETLNESNTTHRYQIDEDGVVSDNGDNKLGVFRTPNVNILFTKEPIYFEFSIPENVQKELQNKYGVIGYFIVRQKRIPTIICQALSCGINKYSYFPMTPTSNIGGKFYGDFSAQTFITSYEAQLVYEPNDIGVTVRGNSDWKYYIYPTETMKKIMFQGKAATVKFRSFAIIGPKGNIPDYLYTIVTEPEPDGYYNSAVETKLNQQRYAKALEILSRMPGKIANPSFQQTPTYNKDTYGITSSHSSGEGNFVNINNGLEANAMGLISVEANVNPELQSLFNGTNFSISQYCRMLQNGEADRNQSKLDKNKWTAKLIYIPEETAYKSIDGIGFSTKVGDGINPQEFRWIDNEVDYAQKSWDQHWPIRGLFTPFIGAVIKDGVTLGEASAHSPLAAPHVYNIQKIISSELEEIKMRGTDVTPFYNTSVKVGLDEKLSVYRGDCYICKTTVRMHRNFIDQNAPIAEQIIDKDCWYYWFRGEDNVIKSDEEQEDDVKDENGHIIEFHHKTDWSKINVGDLNTVALGSWETFDCLSNINLGLRSVDTTHTSEMALMGNPRSFYPLAGMSTRTGMKIADSSLFNMGYGAALGRKEYLFREQVPYNKNEFSTRVMFSNVSVTDSFTNGYRVFQGLAYQDFTKQYGSITKLLPWGNNLFIVFEHGLAIAPVNEKALLQTTTEQTIHIYGHDVLQEQLSVISQDFGSTWADSVIRTPIGIYGFDTSAKKIWRYTDRNGLETLSDMKLQRWLNDHTNIGLDKSVYLGVTNVKTHYNNYKGDVMFTLYNNEEEWNLCYNERQSVWVTRYDWTPLLSVNIDNTFYSIDKNFDRIHAGIYKHGRTLEDNRYIQSYNELIKPCEWYGSQHPFEFEFVVNDPAGLQKIFDNLAIISNNVQPYEIEFEFIGDSYLFNRSKVYHDYKNIAGNQQLDLYGNWKTDIPYKIDGGKDNYPNLKQLFYNVDHINYDNVTDEYTLVVNQLCKNKDSYGVRLGNIQYKEDGWYTNIEPLRYNEILKNPNLQGITNFASAKIRDKWIKIRIKYKGDKLALINAVSTFETISYA